MNQCPICQTETKNQNYCPNCAWEFEYYFDELDPQSKAIYEDRFEIWSGIYNQLITSKVISKRLSFEPEMVLIKGCSFMMGGNGYSNERPIHKVTIDYDFEIGKYPVTFEEYDYFCEETKKEKPNDEGWGRGKLPVINVNWHDAKEYAQWLSKKTGKNYRLPTEAEWEFVARVGTTTKWSFGDKESDLEYYAWYRANSNKKTSKEQTIISMTKYHHIII